MPKYNLTSMDAISASAAQARAPQAAHTGLLLQLGGEQRGNIIPWCIEERSAGAASLPSHPRRGKR